MTSPRSAPKQLETGQEMGAGNGSRFWISGWWRKVLFLGRPDGFRAPGWAPRDQTCARREARRRNGVRAAREGWGGSLPMLAPVRSRCRQGCPQERTCPRSPRDLRPQAGNPGCSPARILGGEKGVLPMASARIGNRSLTPSLTPSRPHQVGFCERRCRISMRSLRPRAGLPRCWRARNRASA